MPPRTDATAAERLRIANLSTLSLWFGLATPFGLVLFAVGIAAESWEPAVVGLWLLLGCCPVAVIGGVAAAFISRRRATRCPRRAVAGGVLGVAGLALLVAMVIQAISEWSRAFA